MNILKFLVSVIFLMIRLFLIRKVSGTPYAPHSIAIVPSLSKKIKSYGLSKLIKKFFAFSKLSL